MSKKERRQRSPAALDRPVAILFARSCGGHQELPVSQQQAAISNMSPAGQFSSKQEAAHPTKPTGKPLPPRKSTPAKQRKTTGGRRNEDEDEDDVISIHSSSTQEEEAYDDSSSEEDETSTLVNSPAMETLASTVLLASQGTIGTNGEHSFDSPDGDPPLLVTQRPLLSLDDDDNGDDVPPRAFQLTRVGRRTPPDRRASTQQPNKTTKRHSSSGGDSKKEPKKAKRDDTPARGGRRSRSSGGGLPEVRPTVEASTKEVSPKKKAKQKTTKTTTPPAKKTKKSPPRSKDERKGSCILSVDKENHHCPVPPSTHAAAAAPPPPKAPPGRKSPQTMKKRNDPATTQVHSNGNHPDLTTSTTQTSLQRSSAPVLPPPASHNNAASAVPHLLPPAMPLADPAASSDPPRQVSSGATTTRAPTPGAAKVTPVGPSAITATMTKEVTAHPHDSASTADVAAAAGGLPPPTCAPGLAPSSWTSAPPPPVTKKLTFQDTVLQHLLESFRPTNLKELAKALKSSETALHYVMMSLVDKQLVACKEFGSGGNTKRPNSKTLYWANFDAKGKDVRHLWGESATSAERNNAKSQATALERENATLATELAQVLQIPSNDDLTLSLERETSALEQLQAQLRAVESRIEQQRRMQQGVAGPAMRPGGPSGRRVMASGAVSEVACPRRLKRRINYYRDEWRKRKVQCMDFVEQLADGLEKKPKDVVKLLDLETDEMVKVTMPAKHSDVS